MVPMKILCLRRRPECSRQLVTSSALRKRIPKARDQSKRNLQGEALVMRLKRREMDIKRQEPYKLELASIIGRFSTELADEERKKMDFQGEQMRREEAEREQEAKNLAIIAKNNSDLKRQRELRKLIEQDEKERTHQENLRLEAQQLAELQKRNTELVLRAIEESKDFVTPDNLEEKIAEALETEVNYNYAITPEGKKVHSVKPPGNLDNWKQPSPHAFMLGGIMPGSGEWNYVFKNLDVGFSRRTDRPWKKNT